jgi:hypothetical protein
MAVVEGEGRPSAHPELRAGAILLFNHHEQAKRIYTGAQVSESDAFREGAHGGEADAFLPREVARWHDVEVPLHGVPVVRRVVGDRVVRKQAKTIDVRVTRYADDITVSGDSIAKLLRFERGLTSLLRANRGVKLTLNEAKRGLYGPGERRMVTGLVLTPDGKISIGRDRKREISALLHRFSFGALDEVSLMRTRGLIAFANSIEPNFVGRMSEKYGELTLTKLIRAIPDAEPTIADYEL